MRTRATHQPPGRGPRAGHAVDESSTDPAPAAAALHLLTARRVLGLQRSVGNTAMTGAVAIATAAHHEDASVQRAPEAPLAERYRDAVAAGRWEEAAVLLNGFNDPDIERLADQLTPEQRKAMRLAAPEWNHRVRRPLLIRDFNRAVTTGQWEEAAMLLNGFNDADIRLLASKLEPGQIGPLMHGAIAAMTGVSLTRTLAGVRDRYSAVSTDPVGTKTLTVVAAMREAGLPFTAASAYTKLSLGVQARPGEAQPTSDDDVRVFAAAMGGPQSAEGAILGGSQLAGVGGGIGGAPGPVVPDQLEKGNLAHSLIGDLYATLNPPTLVDMSVADILTYARRVPGLAKAIRRTTSDLFQNFDMRPDITDLGRMEIFEIKPAGSMPLAVAEAKLYVELFDALGLSEISFKLGNPGNRGATGMIPGPDETLVWASPLPGAIGYAFVKPPDAPRQVQERIRNGVYEPGLDLGPESAIAFGIAAAGALALLPEVSAATFAAYGPLIARLVAAATAAGQAVPEFATR